MNSPTGRTTNPTRRTNRGFAALRRDGPVPPDRQTDKQKDKIMAENHKHYDNGEITVHWKPELCWHAAECVSHLPRFSTRRNVRGWMYGAPLPTKSSGWWEMCPSGALSWSKTEPKG